MSDLSSIERLKFEALFDMESGYVLDFSNNTFSMFTVENVGIDIFDSKYEYGSSSKANRLRKFWLEESNEIVGKLLSALLDYWLAKKQIGGEENSSKEKTLYEECQKIVNRLNQDSFRQIQENTSSPLQKGRIFISYRRIDSAGYAGRIYDRLVARFGENAIFMDVDTIEGGVDFIKILEDAVQSCDVLIALIGRQWLSVIDKDGKRRLDSPEDFVRIEIAVALKRNIRVIPVLVDGVDMPQPIELPENLKALARRNALQVNHHSFNPDVYRLIEHSKAALDEAEKMRVVMKAQALQTAREKAEKEAAEKALLDAEEKARQKAAKEKAEREAAEKAAREKEEKEAAEKVRLEAEELARQKAAKEKAEREKAEQEAAEKERLEAEELTRQKAAKEKAAREKEEREASELAKNIPLRSNIERPVNVKKFTESKAGLIPDLMLVPQLKKTSMSRWLKIMTLFIVFVSVIFFAIFLNLSSIKYFFSFPSVLTESVIVTTTLTLQPTSILSETPEPITTKEAPTLSFVSTEIFAPTESLILPLTPTEIFVSTISALPTGIIGVNGVQMVLVPSGEFIMGSNGASDANPEHKVYLDSYYIDKYEVTNSLYKTCVDVGKCIPPTKTSMGAPGSFVYNYYGNNKYDDYPVIYVNWNMAKSYCEWRNSRLPSEAEWEKAARGTEGGLFPWGNSDPSWDLLNGGWWGNKMVTVGNYEKGKSPYGIYDLAGNAWEWVADWYSENYYDQSPKSNPLGPDTGKYRVVRGGAWRMDDSIAARSAYRFHFGQEDSYLYIGFRCAHDANP